MKPTLVTGGTGFIGARLVRRLVETGVPVRLLMHNGHRLPVDIRSRVEMIQGDVADPGSMARAIRGVDTVLHLAALAAAWGPPERFRAVNVEAVGRLLALARAEGVRRFVHTSTVLGLPPARPAGLSGTAAELTPYEVTKRAADDLVRAAAAEGFPALLVRPTRVYGPGPLSDANGVTKMVDLYLRGRFRLRIADGNVRGNYVFVDDVAEGIRLAALHGRPGGDYLLGGEDATLPAFLRLVSRLSGVRRRVLALPPSLALAVARAAEWHGKLGGTPSITRGWIRVFMEDRPGDLSAARADLGYDPRTLAQGLEETLAWLRRPEARRAPSPNGGILEEARP